MKKLLSLFLVLTLLAGLASTAIAAPAASTTPSPGVDAPVAPIAAPYDGDADAGSDARLAAVTLKVKTRLALDTEGYEEFSGNLSENALAPTWNLYWSGVNGSLNVTATEDGDILSLYRYEYDYYRDPFANVFGPKYPTDGSAAALKAAQAFAALTLDPSIESVTLAQSGGVQPYQLARSSYYGGGDYYFSGVIYLNGVPSPLSMNLSVRADGTVMNFNRDSLTGRYLREVPSATPVTAEAAARALLRGTLALNLEYILDKDEGRAILRYLPVGGDEYYVDAATGALVNRSELFRNVTEIYDGGENRKNMLEDAAAAPQASPELAGGATLNEKELDGIAKLEGVLSKEELDAALKTAMPELGLSGYILSGANYSVGHEKDDDTVLCSLSYSKKLGDGIIRRTVTADGKTAAFRSVYTSYPWEENRTAPTVTLATAEAKAEAFLAAHYADELAGSERTEASDAAAYTYGLTEHGFSYTRKVNGYFYRYNSIRIGIDPLDGSISGFHRDWDADLAFDSPEGIVSEAAAIDAYLAAHTAPVGYIAVPEAIDGASPQYRTLLEQGYGYFFSLALGYQLRLTDGWFEGVDAKTGEALIQSNVYEASTLHYDDIGDSWAKAAIQRLAQYNVGYAGGKFRPASQLTQLDLVLLLVSTDGYLFDTVDQTAADKAYNVAYNMGLLKKADRDDAKALTRMEMVKMILDASGYGRVARLPGIYAASFTDAEQIPEDLYGYAAVALGLGILRGNSNGACMPNQTATRAEAAAMLDQFMSRAN